MLIKNEGQSFFSVYKRYAAFQGSPSPFLTFSCAQTLYDLSCIKFMRKKNEERKGEPGDEAIHKINLHTV